MNSWQKFYKPKGLKERFKNKKQKKATKQKKNPINKPKQKQEGREERELLGLLSFEYERFFCVTAHTQHLYLLVSVMLWPYVESGQEFPP